MTTTLQADAALLAELADLRVQFDAFRREADARIAALEAARPQKTDEAALMASLLSAIYETWGADVFLAEALTETAQLRYTLQGRSVRSTGRLLARHAGKTFAGLTLVAEPPLDRRRQWSVQRVS